MGTIEGFNANPSILEGERRLPEQYSERYVVLQALERSHAGRYALVDTSLAPDREGVPVVPMCDKRSSLPQSASRSALRIGKRDLGRISSRG